MTNAGEPIPGPIDESIDAERVIPPDTGSPLAKTRPDPALANPRGASSVASAAADLDATGGANSLNRTYSGPDDEDDHAL